MVGVGAEAARPPTDTQLLRRILHREAQAAAPEATQPVPEDGSGPQASDLLWLAHVVAAHSILSLASAGQPGLAGPEPEPAEQAAPSRYLLQPQKKPLYCSSVPQAQCDWGVPTSPMSEGGIASAALLLGME